MTSSNDVQRLFIQAVASRRILSQELGSKLWLKCVEAVKGGISTNSSLYYDVYAHVPLAVDETLDIDYGEDRTSWDNWVTKLNTTLNPLDLELSHMSDEATGKEMYALVCHLNPTHPPSD